MPQKVLGPLGVALQWLCHCLEAEFKREASVRLMYPTKTYPSTDKRVALIEGCVVLKNHCIYETRQEVT